MPSSPDFGHWRKCRANPRYIKDPVKYIKRKFCKNITKLIFLQGPENAFALELMPNLFKILAKKSSKMILFPTCTAEFKVGPNKSLNLGKNLLAYLKRGQETRLYTLFVGLTS